MAGCSSSTPGLADSSPSSESAAFPVTLPDPFGDTVIEAAPRKVHSLGYTDHDALKVLGVLPVAVTQWFPEYAIGGLPTHRKRSAERAPTLLDGADGISLETVTAATPTWCRPTTPVPRRPTTKSWLRLAPSSHEPLMGSDISLVVGLGKWAGHGHVDLGSGTLILVLESRPSRRSALILAAVVPGK